MSTKRWVLKFPKTPTGTPGDIMSTDERCTQEGAGVLPSATRIGTIGVRRSVERARKGLWLTAAPCGRSGTKSRGLTCYDRQCGIVRKPLLAARSLTPIIYIMLTSVEEGLP
jgi:hypothetical protein